MVRWSTNEISAGALAKTDEKINTAGNGVPVTVYNPLGWERSGEVSVHVQGGKPGIASGAQIVESKTDEKTGVSDVKLHVLKVPALGYKVVWVGAGTRTQHGGESFVDGKESGNSFTLENEFLLVRVDKQSGCITSLFDKRSSLR